MKSKSFLPTMKKLLIALIVVVQVAYGQDKGVGKISGTITDGSNKQPVEFATVALATEDGKTIDGTVCDEKGKFSLTKVPAGKYNLIISFVGFETKTIPVEISDKRSQIEIGTIAINTEAKVLGEVVVEGERSLIEEKVDRTIYNAENDATTAGGDATDVLKRVPMLTVDFEGNVSLRGSQNIMVLINNKPSTIMASSVADALKQIPAEQIKSVEVITSPSAKYDAEGTGGIINIITKKNTLEGATLNINSSAGFRGSNLGLNGNYRTKKLGISLGGWGRSNYNVQGAFSNEQVTKDPAGINPDVLNLQQADTRNQNLFGNINLGFDYDINKYNALTGSVRLGSRGGDNYQDGLFTQQFINNTLNSSSLRDVYTRDRSNNLDLNLTYTKTFEKPQQEFSVMGLYSRNNRNNDFINDITEENDIASTQAFKNLNDSYNQEVTLQMDYVNPIGETQTIEVGAKNIWRQVYSNFVYLTDPEGDGSFTEIPNSNLTNNLNYDQNVAAGYLAYSLNTKSGYGLKAGARYEYTTINAFTQTESNIDIPEYGVLVPSVNISRKIKNSTVKAAYNRRIQRPSIQFLNPNVQAANPLNVTIGNPELDPEFTDNFELSLSKPIKATSVNVSAFARNTNNSIQRIREVRGDTILTTFQNIGKENAYGMGLNVNIMAGKLTLSGGGDVYYAVLSNNDPNPETNASNEGFVFSGRLFGGYQLKNNWALQAFGFYRGRQVQLQGFQGGFGVYSLSLNKNFNNKKGNIGFGIENFLQKSMKINAETITPTINQRNVNELFNFNAKINFSYRIGKMSFDQRPKRRRSINNDDLKEGGNGGDMGGMNEGQGQQQPMTGGGMPRGGVAAGAGAAGAVTQANAPKPELPQAATDVIYEAAGTWTYTIEGGQPGGGGKIVITKEGDNYSGTIKNDRMPEPVKFTKVTVDGNKVNFAYTMNFGGNEVLIDCNTVITEKEMIGNMSIGQFRTLPIKATRE
jgi:outer membrane receptor for ferrienterochelin and colicin